MITAFLVAQTVKHLPTMPETWLRSLGQEDPLEKERAAAAAAVKSFQSCPTLCDPRDGSPPGPAVPGIKGNPLQYSCLENPMDQEPGRLQSVGSKRVDMTEQLHFTSILTENRREITLKEKKA